MAGKGKGRRSYLNDFHRDVSGQYVYTGAIYRYDGAVPRRRYLARVGILTGLMAVGAVIPGCVDVPAMHNTFYVLLPYIGEVIGAALTLWAAIPLILHRSELRGYVYHGTVESLPARFWVTLGCAAAGAVGNVVFLLLHGFCGEIALSVLPLVCKGVVSPAALLLRRCLGAGRWVSDQEEPGLTRQ